MQCDPNALQLYLAKTANGKWLAAGKILDEILQCGVFPCKMKKMNVVWKLQDMRLFGTGNLLAQGVLHVLVVLPGQRLSIGAAPVAAAAAPPPEPHPARKRRWEELNELLHSSKKAKSEIDSDDDDESPTDNWNLSLNDFKLTMKAHTDTYEIQPKAIEDDKIDALYAHLLLVTKAFGRIVESKDVSRLYLILPILACVCSQFGGDAQIFAEETVAGERVHADGSFEFVVKRDSKRLCVVLAKREDFSQGLAKAYIGCEALADVEGLTEVYSVVTNYKEWYFSRSLDDKIERSDAMLFMQNDIPTRESVKIVAEKIYAMLVDDN